MHFAPSLRLLEEHGEIQLSALGFGEYMGDPKHVMHGPHAHACVCARVAGLKLQHGEQLQHVQWLSYAAVSTMVTVAELLKKDKLAVERSK